MLNMRKAFGRVSSTQGALNQFNIVNNTLASSSGLAPFAVPARMLSTDITSLRNIGISAHIDSGKTTLTERILYYTGRVRDIHEVRGKDGVGAKMDSMDLEREKGITIQSAATHTHWDDHHVNIIDTPGHVDFTIEVERALRVLDGAVLVLCGVAGVQSQSITVDRQMKRYDVPRIAFVNKLDRMGANPWGPIDGLRSVLDHNAAAVQIPIGQEGDFKGVVDLIARKAILFQGPKGDDLVYEDCPADMVDMMEEKREELVERLCDADEELGMMFLEDIEPSEQDIHDAIRRATIALAFTPVFMGSAFKNKGVQPMLDGVIKYLPNPNDVKNYAYEQKADGEEEQIEVLPNEKKPFVGLAFKLEEGRYGQLTYLRVYQGKLKKGDFITDVSEKKKVKVPRVVRMHSNEMEDIDEVGPGEIVALFGIDCVSGATFTTKNLKCTMSSMHVPEPVISLSIEPKDPTQSAQFTKALSKFTREDPTFKLSFDSESQETLISGMGELHLEIYCERLEREYKVETKVGQPTVAYRETPNRPVEFNHLHKKQSGGAGQFARVIGSIEPWDPEVDEIPAKKATVVAPGCLYVNGLTGNNVPPEYHVAIQKGFADAVSDGVLTGNIVQGVKYTVTDGQAHAVDSSEMAFRVATAHSFTAAMKKADAKVLEPTMDVEVEIPSEFQSAAVGLVNRRQGMIQDVETRGNAGQVAIVRAEVPLSKMFGFSTDLRSCTEGKGEFSMVYKQHLPVSRDEQEKLVEDYQAARAAKNK